MTEKILGKILDVRFGFIRDYPFLFGLDLTFKLANSGGVGSGGKYTVNISKECKWSEADRNSAIAKTVDNLIKIMEDANVTNVCDLKNKPVEVTLENNTFKDFRILTEVL